ncbi:hypothetical protein [Vitiosangium sp. GDMCC 1.1324]|uniref:hypothetical protein n=1 Tax=Vitiosangium sp. (strain GDMCC 1.1324) TaxID=2138576 RepID=UPI000D37C42E|nr:hypothetical protein [Vitiosangium sp. GDMCC 1.1324]PTL75130.1 hypothetical protein DAT35_56515 [Vitiosangium sp. GDMCC 1.1324]
MKIGEILSFEAPRLLGRYLTEQTSPEERELLLVARDALLFISEFGQDYRFEDYRRNPDSPSRPLGEGLPSRRSWVKRQGSWSGAEGSKWEREQGT